MNKYQILKSIKTELPYLQMQFGVEEIGVFGSFARGEENTESDLDLMITTKTLQNYFSLLDYLQTKIDKKIDLVTKHQNLSHQFLTIINKDIIYV